MPAAPVDDSTFIQHKQDINTSLPKEILMLEEKLHKAPPQ
jgi:hypothetical protein